MAEKPEEGKPKADEDKPKDEEKADDADTKPAAEEKPKEKDKEEEEEEKKEEKPNPGANLTAQQTRQLKEAFNDYDRDKNGTISKDEIRDVMKQKTGEILSEKELDAMMLSITGNAEKEMGWSDFLRLMQAFIMEDKELKASFDRFDTNGDGQISPEELADVMYRCGEQQLTPADITDMISDVDTNGNGLVSFEEFKKYFRNMAVYD